MNRITYDERREVYLKAIAKYGIDKQMTVAIEEMSEVIKELCKLQRGIGNRDHLAEEIADATIMLEQMRLVFSLNQAVCDTMDEKIERLQRKVWDDSGRYTFPGGSTAVRCTECGCALTVSEFRLNNWNYCPVCGAKMDGGED